MKEKKKRVRDEHQLRKEAIEARSRKFSAIFNSLLQKWLAEDPSRTQKEFGDIVFHEYGLSKDRENTQPQVSRWKNGKALPGNKELKVICKVFNVDPEVFDLDSSTLDNLEYYAPAANMLMDEMDYGYSKLNISPAFLAFLKSIPHYDDIFPLYTPLKRSVKVHKTPLSTKKISLYKRSNYKSLPNIAYSKRNANIQIMKDNTIKVLSLADMHFIHYLQGEIINYIKREFKKREDKLNNEIPNQINAIMSQYWSSLEEAQYNELEHKIVKNVDVPFQNGNVMNDKTNMEEWYKSMIQNEYANSVLFEADRAEDDSEA